MIEEATLISVSKVALNALDQIQMNAQDALPVSCQLTMVRKYLLADVKMALISINSHKDANNVILNAKLVQAVEMEDALNVAATHIRLKMLPYLKQIQYLIIHQKNFLCVNALIITF